MTEQKSGEAFERLLNLPNNRQLKVYAGLFGLVKYYAEEKGDKTAIKLLKLTEESISGEEAWEKRWKGNNK